MPFPHTTTTFRARFKEFSDSTANGTPDDVLQAALDAAAIEIDAAVWGAKALEGHALLTGHKLALDGFGRDGRLKTDDRKTKFLVDFEVLERRVGGAYRFILGEAELT